jgi:putative heme transporter
VPDLQLRVPFATLLKLALFALLVVSAIKLWGVIVLFIIAVLLAVMLDPLVGMLRRHGARRGIAIALIAVLLFGALAAFLIIVVPLMVTQIRDLATGLPKISQRVATSVPSVRPILNAIMNGARQAQTPVRQWVSRGLLAGMYAAEGLIAVVLVLVLTIYLLIEGREMFEWLIAFAPEEKRPRIRRTAHETRGVVLAYMRGQAITCFLCGGVALTTLLILHVPAAVPLAVLAFLCDLVPVIGTIIMTAPAVLLALLVSPMAAIVVVIVYAAYHLVESYVIIPRVYGNQMRLSTLAVLLAVTAGGTLQGPVGAVLILPFVAAYPIVERIWLRDRLPEDTVEKHGE